MHAVGTLVPREERIDELKRQLRICAEKKRELERMMAIIGTQIIRLELACLP